MQTSDTIGRVRDRRSQEQQDGILQRFEGQSQSGILPPAEREHLESSIDRLREMYTPAGIVGTLKRGKRSGYEIPNVVDGEGLPTCDGHTCNFENFQSPALTVPTHTGTDDALQSRGPWLWIGDPEDDEFVAINDGDPEDDDELDQAEIGRITPIS